MPAQSFDMPEPGLATERTALLTDVGRSLHPSVHASRKSIIGDSDEDAIRAFLLEFDGKPTTQRAYRKEVGRFLWWLSKMCKRIDQIDRFDAQAYRNFLLHPHQELIAPRNRVRGSAEWRQFAAPLPEEGVR